MTVKEIETSVDKLPFKEISDSSAIREMVRKNIEPEQLALMAQKGIEIVPMKDGSIKISGLEKVAQVDEKGLMTIDKNWFDKNLRVYQELGIIKMSDELAVQEIEADELGISKIGSLMVVPMSKKREQRTKEEIEKLEVARQLGEDPDRIINVIRIEDRDAGSKMFNDSLEDSAMPLIVRFRNNNFKVMEEKADGTKTELQGFEATPVSKQVAALLKDNGRGNLFTSVRPGEIKAGKTNPNENRYDLFQIRKAGESVDNDSNHLLYVGFSGKTDVNFVDRKNNGELMFDRVPSSSIYPRTVYLEGETEMNDSLDITHEQDENMQRDVHTEPLVRFSDIESRKILLEKLIEIEHQILEIKKEAGNIKESEIRETKEDSESDISETLADKKRKLPDLYSKRSEIIQKLGITEADAIKAKEEEEPIIGSSRRRF